MIELPQIYNDWLQKKNIEESDKHGKSGMFYASSTGSCIKKTLYTQLATKGSEFDSKTLRVFRLGELVHEDIQKAVAEMIPETEKFHVWIEKEFVNKKHNVKCRIDVGFYDENTKIVDIYDIKTVHSYKWSKMFGRKKDTNPSVNYELQLGSYGLAIRDELGDVDQNFYLAWYKKDDSSMKQIEISPEWEEMAAEYWDDINSSPPVTEIPRDSYGSPIQKWECRYCQFESICK